MPYYRKRSNYKPRRYNKNKAVSKSTKSYVNKQIKKTEAKQHPLMFVDILFTGDTLSTVSSTYDLTQACVDALTQLADVWTYAPAEPGDQTHKLKFKLVSYRYQLRFQQNTDGDVDPHNTIRWLIYTMNDTQNNFSNPGLLDGVDIDQPIDTTFLHTAHEDHMRYLRMLATGENDDTAPGTAIVKKIKKIGRVYELVGVKSDNLIADPAITKGGRLWMETQSDSSGAPHPQVFGYIRIYFRLI